MRRAIIRVVLEDVDDLDAVEIKAQVEAILEEMPEAIVEMSLSTVPERPS